jgi:hypothetical protein
MVHDYLNDEINTFGCNVYKARAKEGKIFISSPLAEIAIGEEQIAAFTRTDLILEIECLSGTIRLDRYGNIDIMYRR